MVDTVLSGLERSRRMTSCAVYLLDAEGNGFDLAGSVGAAPKRLESLAIRPLAEKIGKSLSLEDPERAKDPALVAAAATLGELRSSVVLSVRGDDDELVGLICIADDRVRDAFTPEEILLLETVGAQLGVALANSRVYARMKDRDRLAALGSMAAGLAHEVKNPLGAIKGAAQLLEESPHDPSSREFLGIILEETDRLNRVVGSFLDYARPNTGNAAPIDVNAVVKRTVQILSSQEGGVEIALEIAATLPRAKIDAEQLRQVLINLVQNAIQAMNGRGVVTVATGLKRARAGRVPYQGPGSERGGRSEPQESIEISVHDTGPGIAPKVLKNLFVPFFTTKDQGTGLGLAISQRLVQNAGGIIDVQTQLGGGTKFSILLPAADEAASPALPEAAPAA
jgi:signal transduction histidine kinase